MLKAGWSSIRANTAALFVRPQNNFAAIDGVRALSMLAIILYHCFYLARVAGDPGYFQHLVQETPWYLGWVWTLDYSVDAFFVISGYLIAALLFHEHKRSSDINLKRFYWRRYLRLTPAYFAFILLFISLSPNSPPNVWANFLYVNNFLPLAEMSIPWTWSLAVEEQFYLVFPALLLWFVLKSSRPLARLLLLLVASQLCTFAVFFSDERLWNITLADIYFDDQTFHHYYDRFYVNLYTRFGPFVSGAILAYAMAHHKEELEKLRQNRLLFNGLSLAAIISLLLTLGPNPYAGEPSRAATLWHLIVSRNVFGLALVWVLFAVNGPAGLLQPFKRILEWKGWYPIAQLSYSMYLFHYILVLFVMANLMGNLKYLDLVGGDKPFPYYWMPVAFFAATILTLIPATVLHLLVEKPIMQLRDKLGSRSRTTAAAIASRANIS